MTGSLSRSALIVATIAVAAAAASVAAAASAGPAAPSDVTAGLGPSGIVVQWSDNAVDDSGYVIERRSGTEPFGVVGTTAAGGTSFLDPVYGITSYTYRVRAWNDQGYSAEGSASISLVSTGGVVPVTIAASATSGIAPLTVTFTATTSPDATSIEWSFGDGGTASGATVTHTYSGVATAIDATTTFAARVRVLAPSFTGFGSDVGAATSLVTVQLPAVAPPVGLTATSPSKGTVQLAWTNQPSRANQILVQRCQTRSCKYVTVATLPSTATSFTDTRVKPGTYNYRVVAVNTVTGDSAAATVTNVRVR